MGKGLRNFLTLATILSLAQAPNLAHSQDIERLLKYHRGHNISYVYDIPVARLYSDDTNFVQIKTTADKILILVDFSKKSGNGWKNEKKSIVHFSNWNFASWESAPGKILIYDKDKIKQIGLRDRNNAEGGYVVEFVLIPKPGQETQSQNYEAQEEQEQQGPWGIGEWATNSKRGLEFIVNKFYPVSYSDCYMWNVRFNDNLSEEQFIRQGGLQINRKYVVVKCAVRGIDNEPRDVDFWRDLTLYSTTGATTDVEGSFGGFESYQFEAVWKLLNGSDSRYAQVTKYTSATRNIPFAAGSSGIYRLNLKGTIGDPGTSYIELGHEPR